MALVLLEAELVVGVQAAVVGAREEVGVVLQILEHGVAVQVRPVVRRAEAGEVRAERLAGGMSRLIIISMNLENPMKDILLTLSNVNKKKVKLFILV